MNNQILDKLDALIEAVNSTDWTSNIFQIIGSVIPIIFAIWVSKKDNKELDERQKRLEDNIKLLSDYQVKVGLLEKRVEEYYFLKELGDDWVLYYECIYNKTYVPLNLLAKNVLEKYGADTQKYSNEQMDELVFNYTENHNLQHRHFENLKLYFTLNEYQIKNIDDIKLSFVEIYRNILNLFNELKKDNSPSVDFSKVKELNEIFTSEEYKNLLNFLEEQIIVTESKN